MNTVKNKSCLLKKSSDTSLESIREAMNTVCEHNVRVSGHSKFRQFFVNANDKLTSFKGKRCAALWSNQFCISHNKKSPISSEVFSEIKELSKEILVAQFEVLKPDIAIFTVGSGRDQYIKDAFTYETIEVVEPRRLWQFKIGETQCFRVNHPRWHGAKKHLDRVIELAEKV